MFANNGLGRADAGRLRSSLVLGGDPPHPNLLPTGEKGLAHAGGVGVFGFFRDWHFRFLGCARNDRGLGGVGGDQGWGGAGWGGIGVSAGGGGLYPILTFPF